MRSKKVIIKPKPKKLSVAVVKNEKSTTDYDHDFFKWTQTQSKLLKKGQLDELDIANLKEEIEALGKNDKRSLRSYTIVLLTHLLKQKYQPNGQGNSDSWKISIRNSTREIQFLLQDSPSLKNELLKMYQQDYEAARDDAAIETGLPIKTFPKECPWKMDEILSFVKANKVKS